MNKPYDRPLKGNRCQCQGCYEYFNSVYAFDLHRTGPYTDRKCLTPEEMGDLGMSLNGSGFWISETRSERAGRAVASNEEAVKS